MQKPPLNPDVADTAPSDPVLTTYDEEHTITYLRLLDADAQDADWRDVARIVLHLDVNRLANLTHQRVNIAGRMTETALIDLINQKRAGKPITAKARPSGENVVDLMDALRKSLGGSVPAKEVQSTKKPRKRASGQKEMLMPIPGKKPMKEAATKKSASKSHRKRPSGLFKQSIAALATTAALGRISSVTLPNK
jgi:hypothetical protein